MERSQILRGVMTVAMLGLAGCFFAYTRGFYQLIGTSKTRVALIMDTPEVRRLLAEEDRREEEINRFYREPHTQQEGIDHVKDIQEHPDQYPPGRAEFLKAMSQMPGIFVAGGSYCNPIEQSESRCGPSAIYTSKVVLVQVTTGRDKGQRGWMCETSARRTFP